MTCFVEVSRPFQARPFTYESELMWRAGWLWFAVGFLKVPFKQFCLTPQSWEVA